MICGVDEAGRGPVIGPLVVAGVKAEDDSRFVELGVRDSKKLAPGRREVLAREIEKLCEHEVVVVPAGDLDQLMAIMTINRAEAKLFASVIEKLRPRVAYVDSADANEAAFASLISKELGLKVEIVSEHGADERYPVVSAASILAKVRRDLEIERIREQLGEEIGSGYPSDPTTIAFLESWVKRHGTLPPHTRKAWKTSKRILELSRMKKLM